MPINNITNKQAAAAVIILKFPARQRQREYEYEAELACLLAAATKRVKMQWKKRNERKGTKKNSESHSNTLWSLD